MATRLPAATPPPLAIAAADIILAAMDAAAIPDPVKPMAVRATGAAATATTVGRGAGWYGLRGKTHSRNPRQFQGSFYFEQQGKSPKVKKDRAGSQVEAERSVDLTEPGSYQVM